MLGLQGVEHCTDGLGIDPTRLEIVAHGRVTEAPAREQIGPRGGNTLVVDESCCLKDIQCRPAIGLGDAPLRESGVERRLRVVRVAKGAHRDGNASTPARASG